MMETLTMAFGRYRQKEKQEPLVLTSQICQRHLASRRPQVLGLRYHNYLIPKVFGLGFFSLQSTYVSLRITTRSLAPLTPLTPVAPTDRDAEVGLH